jgi:hypothetical protein
MFDEDDIAAIVDEIARMLGSGGRHFMARQIFTRFIAPGRTADQVADLANTCERTSDRLPLFFRPDPNDDGPRPAA